MVVDRWAWASQSKPPPHIQGGPSRAIPAGGGVEFRPTDVGLLGDLVSPDDDGVVWCSSLAVLLDTVEGFVHNFDRSGPIPPHTP